ncbi:MAG: low specificity L-threonine aldolase, partial [Firmicutes bacterium]|nr:low specificity L-threonine aldolase [Bacillota bacterium]
HDHMVFPGMVYISHPSEYGTLYTKAELAEIREICQNYEIPLFIDGARLGYGLASKQTDVTLADIAEYSDVFYIGGTKVGALCGEAVVFTKNNAPKQFVTMTKQRGAMLAKGRLLGIQFDTLFTDDLYLKISDNAIEMAEKLKEILHKKGYRFFLESPTNQQFVYLNDQQLERIKGKVSYSFWEDTPEGLIVRFATSWATTLDDLVALEEIL